MNLQVGDVLTFSYMYSACIPVFYEIKQVVKKSIYVQRMQSVLAYDEDGYGQSGTKVPDFEGNRIGSIERYLVKTDKKGNEYVKIDGHFAYLWNKKPQMYYGD